MLNLMYITNHPDLAEIAINAGVDRIFVDLEIIGKYERQGHRDTLISKHTIEDVARIRTFFPHATLLVRINPFYFDTKQEIENALQYSPQFIMLPMYRSAQEIKKVVDFIDGRASCIPLVETKDALNCIDDVVSIKGVTEIFLGLNDLHMELGLRFMFMLLVDGTVEKFAKKAQTYHKPFGFGGIARLGEGLVPAEHILSEHERLGSTSVILSRTFHRIDKNAHNLQQQQIEFCSEVKKIRDHWKVLKKRTTLEKERDRHRTMDLISEVSYNV